MPTGRIPGPLNQAAKPSSTPGPTRAGQGGGKPTGPQKPADPRQELALDVAQFVLDLIGIAEPTPFADSTNALISIWRGDWLGATASAVSIVPFLGDAAKVVKLPKYLKSVREAIKLAGTDARFARELEPALKRVRTLLDKTPIEKLPDSARAQIQELRGVINSFLHASWIKSLPFGQILHQARLNGSAGGQFFVRRGDKLITANVEAVVRLLEESAAATRHPAIRRDARSMLEMMASGKWAITAGAHKSTSDATRHLTVKIDSVDKQYHLRMDAKGHLWEISHPRGTGLSGIKPSQAPGSAPPRK